MTCYFDQRRDRQTKLNKYSNLDECRGTSLWCPHSGGRVKIINYDTKNVSKNVKVKKPTYWI